MLLKKLHIHIANIPHYNIRIPVYGIPVFYRHGQVRNTTHAVYPTFGPLT